MSELFGPPTPADVSFEDMLACVDREIRLRRQVYPRWVSKGKLTQATADEEILKMRAVRARLVFSLVAEAVYEGEGGGAVWIKLLHKITHKYPEP